MSTTSYRAAPPRGDHVTLPERCVGVNPSRDTAPVRATSRGAGRVTAGPAMPRYLVCVFSGVCGGAEGEPVAAGGAGGWPVVGEADGVAVVQDACPPLRWALSSLSRPPRTF